MPRFAIQFAGSLLLGCALLAAAGLAQTVRADAPVNPLRASGSPPAALRILPADTDARLRLIDDSALGSAFVAAAQPGEQPSIVPPTLGQPELLPPPKPGELFPGDPDLSADAPFQQLVHPWLAEPWFSHSDPNDPHRHIGLGQPLIGTSWRNRPLYFGTFVGGVMMDDLIPNKIYQNDTTFVGARLGYDFDHFWGLEGRWAFARADLADGSGTPFSPASRNNFADLSLVFYPLGDARWRPYLAGGIGFTTFRFNNQLGQRISEAPLDIPLGFGLKYFFSPYFTLRFDFTDNLTVGNDRVSGMHNISLMAGGEFRFGGRRPSYYPWHNNTAYW